MTLSEELLWRRFIQQSTFTDIKQLDGKKWTFYHGFDASADSQTVGNLAAMMFDKVFMRHGSRAFLLAGGATSLIGDPGGKDKERILQSERVIASNVAAAEKQLKKVFTGHSFKMVNNLTWTKNIKLLDFLRDIGKHFSMTPLVQRDYIAQRIGDGGSGISYTEFSYTLLQGYDYLHLHDTYGVDLQLGGSDQWGNCLSGVELIRKARGAEVHTITLPLVIDKSTGKKFGKSEAGAVWLDEHKTSVYKFFQFWINVGDEDVEDYIKTFTELSKPEVDKLMTEHKLQASARKAQKRLAYEVTAIVHGTERAKSVKRISNVLFGGHEYNELSKQDLVSLKSELPYVQVKNGASLVDVLSDSGLAGSRGEARRLLEASAIYINGFQFSSEKSEISRADCLHGFVVLRRGKNDNALIEVK